MAKKENELVVVADEVVGGSFAIDNFDEVKARLANELETYKIDEVNEDTYSLAKDNRATLNAFANALDTKRKNAQKAYMKPFNEGKVQYDTLIKMTKEVADTLGDGIRALDDEGKETKKQSLKDYFNKANDIPFLIYEAIEDTKWYNKTTPYESAVAEINLKIKQIQDNITTMKSLVQDKNSLAVVLAYYAKSLDMESAITNAMAFIQDINMMKEYLKKGE